jgi:hypothetical protein
LWPRSPALKPPDSRSLWPPHSPPLCNPSPWPPPRSHSATPCSLHLQRLGPSPILVRCWTKDWLAVLIASGSLTPCPKVLDEGWWSACAEAKKKSQRILCGEIYPSVACSGRRGSCRGDKSATLRIRTATSIYVVRTLLFFAKSGQNFMSI